MTIYAMNRSEVEVNKKYNNLVMQMRRGVYLEHKGAGSSSGGLLPILTALLLTGLILFNQNQIYQYVIEHPEMAIALKKFGESVNINLGS